MAKQIAAVIQWTKEYQQTQGNQTKFYHRTFSRTLGRIGRYESKYGIDPKVFLILNDAAGLDMKYYLEENPPTAVHNYITTWTSSPVKWQDASPIYFLDKNTPPFFNLCR
jgi:hypothetical protein